MRLAIVASHPVQYYAPLFRALATRLDLTVYYAHRATPADQARAGFGVSFEWNVDLFSGYAHEFLQNVASTPSLCQFKGVDTPEIRRRLRFGNFDAVLLMGWHLKCYHQALWTAKRLGVPVLVRGDSHLDTPRAAWKRLAKAMVYPIFLRCFDGALVVGARNRAYWRHYGYPESQMFDAPHCVDNDWFASRATEAARYSLRARFGIARDSKVVLFVGKLVPIKRPKDLVGAASMVRNNGVPVEVLIAGTGPLEMDVCALAREMKVPLHLLGFCNQTEMPFAYAAADVMVLPSESETWGLVANEALACGKPIVVSDAVGCAPDLALPGTGVIYPVGDVAAMAAAIAESLALLPGNPAIARASARYSLSHACDGIIAATHALARRQQTHSGPPSDDWLSPEPRTNDARSNRHPSI